MIGSRRSYRSAVAFAALVAALAGLVALPATSSAAPPCHHPTSAPVVSGNSLYYDVAALSPCKAWAVGYDATGSLIERWNGTSWVRQTSDDPPTSTGTYVSGVSAISGKDVWATGVAVITTYRGFIEHWNGSSWKRVATPTLLNGNFLEDVSAVGPHDVWAVGSVFNGSAFVSLVEHWNGTKWKLVAHPQPGTAGGFAAVDARSANDVWAVGNSFTNGSPNHTLIEHWNGKKWSRVPSPNAMGLSASNSLASVSVRTATDAWAVGQFNNINGKSQTLTEHWNGKSWKRVKSPNPGGGLQNNQLNDVVDVGPRSAWAVGSYIGGGVTHALVLHWNGKAWTTHPTRVPSTATAASLNAVAASALSDVWWAGDATVSAIDAAYVTHCC